MKKIKIAVIGAGFRGMYTYGDFAEKNKDLCEIVAIVEGKKGRRELFKKRFNLDVSQVYENIEDFFAKDKMADGVIICNYDSLHYKTTSLALEKGYEVLLEGPLANNIDEIIRLEDLCSIHNERIVLPAMPYVFSDFFIKIKQIIQEKRLGELIHINYNSYIGYENFIHKYVRGNWRIDSDSATLMLTNSCYDLDILAYLSGSKYDKVSSFGKLYHFTKDNFNENMSEACDKCKVKETCPYCAQKMYLKTDKEINKGVHINPTKENLNKILENTTFGRCVYSCDNDTYDNVVSILKFENNISTNLNIIGLSDREDREIRLTFSHGELVGSLSNRVIKIKKFINEKENIIKIKEENIESKLIESFIEFIDKKQINNESINIKRVFHSHIVAFAAEFANVSESVIDVNDFYEESVNLTKFMTEI